MSEETWNRIRDFFWFILTAGIIILATWFSFGIIGCQSAVQDTTRAAQAIKGSSVATTQHLGAILGYAESSRQRFEFIGAASFDPEIQAQAADGIVEQEAIKAEAGEATKLQTDVGDGADRVLTNVPKMKDVQPLWASALGKIALIVATLGGIFVLIYFAPILRKLIMAAGFMIPKAARQKAALMEKVVDDGDPATPREMMIELRASDPAFDAAMRRRERERERGRRLLNGG